MASSTNISNVRDPDSSTGRTTQESRHNPHNQPFTCQTWAELAKKQERTNYNVSPNLDSFDLQNLNTYFSKNTPFLEATEPHSIVMDCSQFDGMTFGQKDLNTILREQYPTGLILTMRAVGKSKKFFEISFLNEEERIAALNRQFTVHGKDIVVSPTLGTNANIIRVGITGIPGLDENSIRVRLTEILSQCGDILELGLHHIPSGHWFNGRGFATLNRDTSKVYPAELHHQIDFSGDRKITLVWSNMKMVCKECHSEDHIKADCPVVLERNLKRCFECQSPDHLKADCPSARWNRRRKVPRTDAVPPTTGARTDNRSPRLQGRPNGPPPIATFNPFEALDFSEHEKAKGPVSSVPATSNVAHTASSTANFVQEDRSDQADFSLNASALDARTAQASSPSQEREDDGKASSSNLPPYPTVAEEQQLGMEVDSADVPEEQSQNQGMEVDFNRESSPQAPPSGVGDSTHRSDSSPSEYVSVDASHSDGSSSAGYKTRYGRVSNSPARY